MGKYYVNSSGVSFSESFLVPLLAVTKTAVEVKWKPRSYLYWEGQGIENTELVLRYTPTKGFDRFEEERILTHKDVQQCYDLEGGDRVYLFDMSLYWDTVANFLEGKYSNFTEQVKKGICHYHGEYRDPKTAPPEAPYLISLYPQYYRDRAAEELGVDPSNIQELAPMFDKDVETLTGTRTNPCCTEQLFLSKVTYNK